MQKLSTMFKTACSKLSRLQSIYNSTFSHYTFLVTRKRNFSIFLGLHKKKIIMKRRSKKSFPAIVFSSRDSYYNAYASISYTSASTIYSTNNVKLTLSREVPRGKTNCIDSFGLPYAIIWHI